jgi:hypothetical protein
MISIRFWGVLFVVLVLALGSHAKKYKGHDRVPSEELFVMTEPVDRYIEREQDFLILFNRHPAFYRFPKREAETANFKAFLDASIKSKKKLLIKYEPRSAQIISIEPAP